MGNPEVENKVPLSVYKNFTEAISKAYKASYEVLAENKRLGIPSPFSFDDRIYYLMPDGRIVLKKSASEGRNKS